MSKTAIEIKKRNYLPEDFEIADWNSLLVYFEELEQRAIENKADFEKWLLDSSELGSYISENMAWRYIKMTCDTTNLELQKSYQDFVENIQPHLSEYSNKLDQKILELAEKYPVKQTGFDIMIRGIKESVRIFRKENIPLFTESQLKEAEYQAISGKMSVNLDGEEMTLPKAASLLLGKDRAIREKAWRAISERRYADKDELNDNFSGLLSIRNQVALNAGFENYRDYMFSAMGRFDYSPQDCFDFHESVEAAIVPVINELEAKRKEKLALSSYRPWDTKADIEGKEPLKPFQTGHELLDKTVKCFDRIHPDFARYIEIMREMGHFDVESGKGKAPGGYNYPLQETGVPFIFMNATGTNRDMVTMVHEGGHAIHSFLTRDLPLSAYKNPPMEVAELASMSMELISMEHWEEFFPNPDDLKRAKKEHLEDILGTLPWIATIDKFQHWIYENPNHTPEERAEVWVKIFDRFSDSVTDWSGLEEFKKYGWQKQLHIYEVPFYYIEYGFAQLGAISIWKNYKENPKRGVRHYIDALSLGYTKGIKDIYETAGIKFDFSKTYISDLISFVVAEWKMLD